MEFAGKLFFNGFQNSFLCVRVELNLTGFPISLIETMILEDYYIMFSLVFHFTKIRHNTMLYSG